MVKCRRVETLLSVEADLEDLVCRNVPNSSQSLIYRPVFNLPRDLSLVLKLINVEQRLFPQKRRTGDFWESELVLSQQI